MRGGGVGVQQVAGRVDGQGLEVRRMPERRCPVHRRHSRRIHEHDVRSRVAAVAIGMGKRGACEECEEEDEGESKLHWMERVSGGEWDSKWGGLVVVILMAAG